MFYSLGGPSYRLNSFPFHHLNISITQLLSIFPLKNFQTIGFEEEQNRAGEQHTLLHDRDVLLGGDHLE